MSVFCGQPVKVFRFFKILPQPFNAIQGNGLHSEICKRWHKNFKFSPIECPNFSRGERAEERTLNCQNFFVHTILGGRRVLVGLANVQSFVYFLRLPNQRLTGLREFWKKAIQNTRHLQDTHPVIPPYLRPVGPFLFSKITWSSSCSYCDMQKQSLRPLWTSFLLLYPCCLSTVKSMIFLGSCFTIVASEIMSSVILHSEFLTLDIAQEYEKKIPIYYGSILPNFSWGIEKSWLTPFLSINGYPFEIL